MKTKRMTLSSDYQSFHSQFYLRVSSPPLPPKLTCFDHVHYTDCTKFVRFCSRALSRVMVESERDNPQLPWIMWKLKLIIIILRAWPLATASRLSYLPLIMRPLMMRLFRTKDEPNVPCVMSDGLLQNEPGNKLPRAERDHSTWHEQGAR